MDQPLIASGAATQPTKPEEAPEQPLEAEPGPARMIVVQVHSFRSQPEAKWGAAILERSGYTSFTRYQTNVDGTSWHVVYVGPFEELAGARQTLQALRATGLDPVVRIISSK